VNPRDKDVARVDTLIKSQLVIYVMNVKHSFHIATLVASVRNKAGRKIRTFGVNGVAGKVKPTVTRRIKIIPKYL
jgi:hypothetical protein